MPPIDALAIRRTTLGSHVPHGGVPRQPSRKRQPLREGERCAPTGARLGPTGSLLGIHQNDERRSSASFICYCGEIDRKLNRSASQAGWCQAQSREVKLTSGRSRWNRKVVTAQPLRSCDPRTEAVVLYRRAQDRARFGLHRTIVRGRLPLDALLHVLIEVAHGDCCHESSC